MSSTTLDPKYAELEELRLSAKYHDQPRTHIVLYNIFGRKNQWHRLIGRNMQELFCLEEAKELSEAFEENCNQKSDTTRTVVTTPDDDFNNYRKPLV